MVLKGHLCTRLVPNDAVPVPCVPGPLQEGVHIRLEIERDGIGRFQVEMGVERAGARSGEYRDGKVILGALDGEGGGDVHSPIHADTTVKDTKDSHPQRSPTSVFPM